MSFGPFDLFVPPGDLLGDRSTLSTCASPLVLLGSFMIEPMLGIELAPLACPFAWVGVEFELSCLGGIGDGDREYEDGWFGCCAKGDGTMRRGSILDIGGSDEGGRFCACAACC